MSHGCDTMTSCLAAAAVAIATTRQLAWRSLRCRGADVRISFSLQALPFCTIIPAFCKALQSLISAVYGGAIVFECSFYVHLLRAVVIGEQSELQQVSLSAGSSPSAATSSVRLRAACENISHNPRSFSLRGA